MDSISFLICRTFLVSIVSFRTATRSSLLNAEKSINSSLALGFTASFFSSISVSFAVAVVFLSSVSLAGLLVSPVANSCLISFDSSDSPVPLAVVCDILPSCDFLSGVDLSGTKSFESASVFPVFSPTLFFVADDVLLVVSAFDFAGFRITDFLSLALVSLSGFCLSSIPALDLGSDFFLYRTWIFQ